MIIQITLTQCIQTAIWGMRDLFKDLTRAYASVITRVRAHGYVQKLTLDLILTCGKFGHVIWLQSWDIQKIRFFNYDVIDDVTDDWSHWQDVIFENLSWHIIMKICNIPGHASHDIWTTLFFINDVIDDVIEIKITKWRMKSYLGIIAYQNSKQKHESHGLF